MALIELGRKLKPGACFAFSEPNLLNPINKYIIFTRDMGKRKKHGVSPTEMAFRPKELISLCRQAGFNVLTIEHRDFLHPSVPRGMIVPFKLAQFFAERVPLIRCWSGSLWIYGRK
jgi:hypothetical protein